MIVEFLENDFQKDLFKITPTLGESIRHLEPVFERLGLTPPRMSEVMMTRDNGFCLFLNDYGMVLRFHLYGEQYDGCVNMRDEYHEYGHLYHENGLPFIGCVRYPKFTMLLMPGLELADYKDDEEPGSITYEMDCAFIDTIGKTADATLTNIGFYGPKKDNKEMALIDTVYELPDLAEYDSYLASSSKNIINSFVRYNILQKAFHDAWIQDKKESMQSFWTLVKKHKDNQLSPLNAGWLAKDNHALKVISKEKGHFIRKSRRYQKRCQNLNI